MSENKKSFYTSEFKESAIKLAIDSDRPISAIAKELGLKVNTLYNWIHKYHQSKGDVVGVKNDNINEIKRLTKELNLVKQERDLLKKAAAYFAKHTQ